MKVVVTGASGFIGSAAVDLLLERGHQVIALSRNCQNADLERRQNISWVVGPLGDSSADKINSLKPDACIHSAWIATPGIYLDSEENERLIEVSYQFLKRLEQGGIKRIVGVGTCFEKIPDHSSKYVQAKKALRQKLEEAISDEVHVCWARVFFPYGRGEHPKKLPSYLIETLSKNEVPDIKSPHSVNDYIHIFDVVNALVLIAESGRTGLYEIGSGSETSVITIANLIASALGKEELLGAFAERDLNASRIVQSIIADRTTLESLGWKPQISIAAGIDDLLQLRAASHSL